MATTNIHPSPNAQQRSYERREERSSYAAVWGLLAIALIAAVAFGVYSGDRLTDRTTVSPTQAQVVPANEGNASSMIGTGPASNELTPSPVAPGSPDTTTTESTSVPAQGIE